MLLAVHFPSWLSPEIIPGLPLRWYGLMYLVAFALAYFLFRKQVKERKLDINEDDGSSLFFWGILALLIGARIFAVLVYDTSGMYLRRPWLVFWPFENGRFVGLQGMSYHGGLVGAIVGIVAYCRYKKWNIREIGDLLVAGIPLGYTFGRLGNFINGELYGRVSSGPFAMYFPHARGFDVSEGWVQDIAREVGLSLSGIQGTVNLPRHPSQLYEALFEGVFLWLVIWFLRNKRPFRGFLIGIYVIGYGLVRFVIEYFREPDSDLGYRIELVKTNLPPALFSSPFNLSTGQILCLLMILGGLIFLLVASRMPNREPGPLSFSTAAGSGANEPEDKKSQASKRRNERRKLRNKLK